jgi:hypothetical protein
VFLFQYSSFYQHPYLHYNFQHHSYLYIGAETFITFQFMAKANKKVKVIEMPEMAKNLEM